MIVPVKRLLLRQKTDVALVVMAIALTIVVLIDRGSVTTAEAEERQYQLIDAWRADDILTVDITMGPRKLALSRTKDAGGSTSLWSLSEDGREVVADEQSVEQLLITLEFAGYQRKVDGLDDATTGFSKPLLSYALSMGKLSYTVVVGKEAPSPPGAHYVRVTGGARGARDYVVHGPIIEELTVERGALRARRLAPYISPALSSIELSGRFKLTRGGWGGRTAGAFAVSSDEVPRARADRQALDGWLAMLALLDAEKFVPIPDEDPAGALALILTPFEGEPAKIMLSGPSKECGDASIVIRRQPDPMAGCVPSDVVEQLSITASALADRHVVGTAEGDITELIVTSESASIEVARKDTGWHMRQPVEGPAQAEPVDKLIKELLSAAGDRVSDVDRAAMGLDKPRARLQLRGLPERGVDGAKERLEKISVGARKDRTVYVERHDDGVVLAVNIESARALTPRPSTLRSTQIYDFPLEHVTELRTDCDGRVQRLTRAPAGTWTVERPDIDLVGDAAQANELTHGFRQLRGLRWVSEKAEDGHGLAAPWCVVAIDTTTYVGDEAIDSSYKVSLGAESRDGYFAKHDDDQAVFIAPKAMAAAARYWMLDRAALIVEMKDIATMTLRAGEKSAGIDKQSPAWKAAGQLFAEGVTHLGAPRDGNFDEPQLTITLTPRAGDPIELVVGKGDVWRNTTVFYVRKKGLAATFALAQSRLKPLFSAL